MYIVKVVSEPTTSMYECMGHLLPLNPVKVPVTTQSITQWTEAFQVGTKH